MIRVDGPVIDIVRRGNDSTMFQAGAEEGQPSLTYGVLYREGAFAGLGGTRPDDMTPGPSPELHMRLSPSVIPEPN
jgi:hypothetical protein